MTFAAARRDRFGIRLVFASAAVFFAAGCNGSSGSASSSGLASPDTRSSHLVVSEGGGVTISLPEVPKTLNDHTEAGSDDYTRMVDSVVYPHMFAIAPGTITRVDNYVVDSAEVVSLNPQTVVYRVDPRATWSDGVPMGADDFVYAWQSQRGGATDVDGAVDSVAATLGYRDIESVSGSSDAKTVTVVFKTPYADWPSLFSDLLPAHIARSAGWNRGFNAFGAAAQVSGGPWQVASWTPAKQITLTRNPHWWGTQPHLSSVQIVAQPDLNAAVTSLRSQQLTASYLSTPDPSVVARLSSLAAYQTQANLGTRVLQLLFNTRRAPLDSALVRTGLAHYISRASIVSSVAQAVDNGTWVDNDHLFSNIQPWYQNDANSYTFADPISAQKLLAEAGLSTDTAGTWNGRLSPITLRMTWASDDPWAQQVGPRVAADLVTAGFDVSEVPSTSTELFSSMLPAGDFDLAIVPIEMTAYPSQLASAFSEDLPAASIAGIPPLAVLAGFDDPKVDALFAAAAQQLAAQQASSLYQQIDQLLWADMPTLPLFAEPQLLVNQATVLNVHDDVGGYGPLWQLDGWQQVVPASKRYKDGERKAGTAR